MFSFVLVRFGRFEQIIEVGILLLEDELMIFLVFLIRFVMLKKLKWSTLEVLDVFFKYIFLGLYIEVILRKKNVFLTTSSKMLCLS